MAQNKKFSFLDIMNHSAVSGKINQEFQEIYLSPYEVKPSENNFYSQESISELADSFLTVGQQQPIVLALINGEYKIVSGHRRNAANILNIERQKVDRNIKIRYLYKEMTPAMLELSLIIGNAMTRKLTAYEEVEQMKRLKAALIKAKKQDGLVLQGTIREIVAELMEESETNIARMSKIDKSLIPEAKEKFKDGEIGITTAYEMSRMGKEEQAEIIEQEADEKNADKSIAEIVKERKERRKEQQTKQQEKTNEKAAEKPSEADCRVGLEQSESKYCWGFTRDEMNNLSNSIPECIKEAKEMKGLDFVPRFIYIGERKIYEPNAGFGVYMLEHYANEAEYYESNWLEFVLNEDEKLLDEMISEAFKRWCEETGNEPNFCTIENIKKYSLATGKEIK